MSTKIHHSPGSSLDSDVVSDCEPGFNQSQGFSEMNTASLLKSFIKENLRGSHESTGGASSSDESADMDLMRNNSTLGMNITRTDSVTPEPQPLTRSNVTMHDGIWRTDVADDQASGSQNLKPISLSPPLKGLRIPQSTDESRRPWERGILEQSLSDAESDHSYSSQDTMILKATEEAARGHLKYLEMYENARSSSSNGSVNSLPTLTRRPVGLVRPHDFTQRTNTVDDVRPSTSGQSIDRGSSPSRRVRFANDIQFQEQNSGAAPPQRSLNVDYAQMLGRSGGDHPPDQDDGYESTDNASSTSSSSNGADLNANSSQLNAIRNSPDPTSSAANNSLKTEFGYVDRTQMPSFRRMNMELRKKAVIKSAVDSTKNSVEDKLRALCIDTDQDNDAEVQGENDYQSPNGSDQSGPIEFEPRDASSPVLYGHPVGPASNTESAYRIGNLDLIGRGTDEQMRLNHHPDYSTGPNVNEHLDYGSSDMTASFDSENIQTQHADSIHAWDGDYVDGDDKYRPGAEYKWDNRTPVSIPDQPRRPAPVLRDNKSSTIKSFSSTGNINAIYSERSVVPPKRPMSDIYSSTQPAYPMHSAPRPMSEMYSSQPQLQTDDNVHNLGTMSSMFKSEPQLQRKEYHDGGTDVPDDEYHQYGSFGGSTMPDSSTSECFENPYQGTTSYPAMPANTGTGTEGLYSLDSRYRSEAPYRSESPVRSDYTERPSNNPQRSHSPQMFATLPRRAQSPARSTSPCRSVASDRDRSDFGSVGSSPRHPSFGSDTSHQARDSPSQPTIYINNERNTCDIPGVYVYRSGSSQVHPTTSDENLNTSGSTGSNDSGIDHSSVDTNQGFPQPMFPSESRGHRAPVNYTLDDTSRDPMGLVEKVKRRRESSPVRRALTDTPPLTKAPEKGSSKSSLLCQPGEFTTPSTREMSRMKTQQRTSPVGPKMQPMKALPINSDPEWNQNKLDGTAKKMLDSQGNKLKDEYSRYLQLYSKFQRENSNTASTHEQCTPDGVTSRRSNSPVSQSSSSGEFYPETSPYGSRNELQGEVLDNAAAPGYTHPRSFSPRAPTTEVKYMRTADIYKMMEEQRGPARLSQSQPTTPTSIAASDWGANQTDDAKRGNTSFERGNTSFERGNTSFERGNSSFERGNSSVERGNSSVEKGNSSFERGNSSFERGNTSFERGNRSLERGDSSFENLQDQRHSGFGRRASSPDQCYRYGAEPSRHSPSGPSPRGGSTVHATNADIYSLYTGAAQQRHKAVAGDVGTTKKNADRSSYLHI